MGWFRWVLDRLEKTRGKPVRPRDHVEGLHGEVERAKAEAWAGTVVGSLISGDPSMLALVELDKRSAKR